jgi:hypothetical protein
LPGRIGHDWGGVGVEIVSSNIKRRVSVISDSGGQRIAVMPASVMTSLLLSGSAYCGLVSPANWLTFERFCEESQKRGFRVIVEHL